MSGKFLILLLGTIALSGCMGGKRIEATKSTDAAMTCEDIKAEVDEMRAVVDKVNGQNTATHATNVGTAVGGHAAALSGVPFLGMAISSAGGIANMSAPQREELKNDAQMRISTLNGIAIGKGCKL